MQAAAQGAVAKRAIDALTSKDSKATLETLEEWATKAALDYTMCPAHSTSPAANLMDQYKAAGWARVARVIRRGF